MAFRTVKMLKCELESSVYRLSSRRWSHIARPAPLDSILSPGGETSSLLPGFCQEYEEHPKTQLPNFSIGSAMELMAVPKKKVSKHKRGIRNGPKALKPIPVIVRCRACGRVKLPHFFCCSGDRGAVGEHNDSTS